MEMYGTKPCIPGINSNISMYDTDFKLKDLGALGKYLKEQLPNISDDMTVTNLHAGYSTSDIEF